MIMRIEEVSNDLHPPKPKHNMGKTTLKCAVLTHILLACIKSASFLSNCKSLMIKHFDL